MFLREFISVKMARKTPDDYTERSWGIQLAIILWQLVILDLGLGLGPLMTAWAGDEAAEASEHYSVLWLLLGETMVNVMDALSPAKTYVLSIS